MTSLPPQFLWIKASAIPGSLIHSGNELGD